MKFITKLLLVFSLLLANTHAQTDGEARFEGTLVHYSSSNERHYTVAWVTTESGSFIKSLRKQGPSSWSNKEWADHCSVWNTARRGSQALDGYTSATAANYTGTNSPVVWTWNCRDTNNVVVPDGRYKFWIQYAENAGQGPYTTNGLLWTKSSIGETNTYPDQRIKKMRVAWSPYLPLRWTSIQLDDDEVVLNGQGPAGKAVYVVGSNPLNQSATQWNLLSTNIFDASGHLVYSNRIDALLEGSFFLLKLP